MVLEQIDLMPTITDFTTNVSIFRNTRAMDIPDKMNAIGEAIKEHNNTEIVAKVNTYISTEVQPKLQGITDTLETTMNNYTSATDANLAAQKLARDNDWVTYTTEQDSTVAAVIATAEADVITSLEAADAQRLAFEQATAANLYENTSTITGYTVAQVDNLLKKNATGVARRMAFV